jgi:RNA polymerase sigma-70 factor (ECF subfamily)
VRSDGEGDGGVESDRHLVERVIGGDREAYAGLVERYQHAVFAVALGTLRDRDTAGDAAQNAFVAAYEHLSELRDASAFGPWLLVIARREASRLARNRPRTVSLAADHDQPAGAADPEAWDLHDGRLSDVMAALGELPDHEQRVLMLRYFDAQPVAGIASITGRTIGTVTKQISRALRRLRKQLSA